MGGSEEQRALNDGSLAIRKLHNNDEYTSLADLYIGFSKKLGEWSSLNGQSKSNFFKNAYRNNNASFLYTSLEYLSNYLQAQNNRFYEHYNKLTLLQKTKIKKNQSIITGISNLKAKVNAYMKQYTLESIARFVDNVLLLGWESGNLDLAANSNHHILIVDPLKLYPKGSNNKSSRSTSSAFAWSGFDNNGNVSSYSNNNNNNNNNRGYRSYPSYSSNSNSSSYSSYKNNQSSKPQYGYPPAHAAPTPMSSNYDNNNNNNSSYSSRSRVGSRRNFRGIHKSRILSPMTPNEASGYKTVYFAQFRPSNEIVLVKINPSTTLAAVPGSCHRKNLEGNCFRMEGTCKFGCYCTICHSTKHGRIHCPARGDKI